MAEKILQTDRAIFTEDDFIKSKSIDFDNIVKKKEKLKLKEAHNTAYPMSIPLFPDNTILTNGGRHNNSQATKCVVTSLKKDHVSEAHTRSEHMSTLMSKEHMVTEHMSTVNASSAYSEQGMAEHFGEEIADATVRLTKMNNAADNIRATTDLVSYEVKNKRATERTETTYRNENSTSHFYNSADYNSFAASEKPSMPKNNLFKDIIKNQGLQTVNSKTLNKNSLDFIYPFRGLPGEHSVKVQLPIKNERQSKVILTPSGSLMARLLQRNIMDLPIDKTELLQPNNEKDEHEEQGQRDKKEQ